MNAQLLITALDSAGFAGQMPGLSGAVLAEIFADVGINAGGTTGFSQAQTDTQVLVPLLNSLKGQLQSVGVSGQVSESIIDKIANSLAELKGLGPIQSGSEFVHTLTHLLQQGGVLGEMAAVLALFAAGNAIGDNPQMLAQRAVPEGFSPTFSALHSEQILAALAPLFGQQAKGGVDVYQVLGSKGIRGNQLDDAAIELQGLSREDLFASIQAAIGDVQTFTSVETWAGKGVAPTAELIERQFIYSLQQQGLSRESAAVIAKVAFAVLESALPGNENVKTLASIGVLQSTLRNHFQLLGVDARAANQVISQLLQKGIVFDGVQIGQVVRAVKEKLVEIRTILEEQLQNALTQQGISQGQAASIAQETASGFLSNTQESFSQQRHADIIKELLNRFEAISEQAASDIAEYVVNEQIRGRQEALKDLVEMQQVSKSLEKVLIERGALENAAAVSEQLAVLLHSIRLSEQVRQTATVQGALADVIAGSVPLPQEIVNQAVGSIRNEDVISSQVLSVLQDRLSGLSDGIGEIANRAFEMTLRSSFALETLTSFKEALIENLNHALPGQEAQVEEAIRPLSLAEFVNRTALEEKLVEGFQKAGITDMGIAGVYAQFAAEGVVRNTEQLTALQAVSRALQGFLATASGVPLNVFVEQLREEEVENILTLQGVEEQMQSFLVGENVVDRQSAPQVVHSLLNALIFPLAAGDRDRAINSSANFLGSTLGTATELVRQMDLREAVNRHELKTHLEAVLAAVGYNSVEAASLSRSIAVCFLNSEDAGALAQEIAIHSSKGVEQLQENIAGRLLQIRVSRDAKYLEDAARQISQEVCKNPESGAGVQSFRRQLALELFAALPDIAEEQAEALAAQIPITPALQQEVLCQQIIRLGV